MAFYRYPQLITKICRSYVFGPPLDLHQGSPWPRIDHLVSGLASTTNRRLRLAFAVPNPQKGLSSPSTANSLARSAKSTTSLQKGALFLCRHMASGTISLPSPGYFSPFPHGTSSLSVIRVFSLGCCPSQIPTGFHVSDGTWEHYEDDNLAFAYRAITVSGGPFQGPSANQIISLSLKGMQCPTTSLTKVKDLDSSPFARHY